MVKKLSAIQNGMKKVSLAEIEAKNISLSLRRLKELTSQRLQKEKKHRIKQRVKI